jgi:hypothetical protein
MNQNSLKEEVPTTYVIFIVACLRSPAGGRGHILTSSFLAGYNLISKELLMAVSRYQTLFKI